MATATELRSSTTQAITLQALRTLLREEELSALAKVRLDLERARMTAEDSIGHLTSVIDTANEMAQDMDVPFNDPVNELAEYLWRKSEPRGLGGLSAFETIES